jgi:parvulin-like peptidyl-prolyl isomerase
LAREHSRRRERGGGDLGWVDPRVLPATLVSAVSAILMTGVAPVVQTKTNSTSCGSKDGGPRQLPLDEVKEQIKQALTSQKKQTMFAEWVAGAGGRPASKYTSELTRVST